MKRSLRRTKEKKMETDSDSANIPHPKPPTKRNAGAKKKKADPATATSPNDSLTSPYFQSLEGQPGGRLSKSFYNQDTISLAKALLGKVLCRKLPETGDILRGTIVETEAYPGVGDAASHSFKGVPTQSSMAMFMDPGTAYVYMTYGMYYCFNISSQDIGGACLLRAAEVHEDYEIMHTFRQAKKKQSVDKPTKRLKQNELANGPSKLCLAFDIDRTFDKTDTTTSDTLWLEESSDPKFNLRHFEVKESMRVGIDSTPPEARNKLYRFFIDENSSVSKAKFKSK